MTAFLVFFCVGLAILAAMNLIIIHQNEQMSDFDGFERANRPRWYTVIGCTIIITTILMHTRAFGSY